MQAHLLGRLFGILTEDKTLLFETKTLFSATKLGAVEVAVAGSAIADFATDLDVANRLVKSQRVFLHSEVVKRGFPLHRSRFLRLHLPRLSPSQIFQFQ